MLVEVLEIVRVHRRAPSIHLKLLCRRACELQPPRACVDWSAVGSQGEQQAGNGIRHAAKPLFARAQGLFRVLAFVDILDNPNELLWQSFLVAEKCHRGSAPYGPSILADVAL